MKANELHQWDQGQKLVVEGIDLVEAPLVHFARKIDKTAYVVQATLEEKKIIANIPNELLTTAIAIRAYINQEDTTILEVQLPVKAKAKPKDYVEDATQTTVWGQITEAKQSAIDASQLAEKYKKESSEIQENILNTKNAIETIEENIKTLATTTSEDSQKASTSAKEAGEHETKAIEAAQQVTDSAAQIELNKAEIGNIKVTIENTGLVVVDGKLCINYKEVQV